LLLKKISNNIILLGVVSLLNDFSSEMILPILPLFIESLGGGAVAVGVLGGIRDSLSSLLNVVSGYMAGRTGKNRIFVFAGYLASGVFKLFLGLSGTFGQAILFSSLERVGKGLRTAPRDAIISESMPEKKGTGFGVHRAFDTAGAVLGSICAFIFLWSFGLSYKSIIIIAAVLSFFSVLPLIFVRESRQKREIQTLSVSLKALPSRLKRFILIASVFALGNFSYMFFVLRASEAFSGSLSKSMPVLLYVFFNIFYVIFAVPLGALSDRIGKGKIIAGGYLLFSIVSSGFIFFHSAFGLVILFALYGIANAAIDSTQRAFVADLAGAELKSVALGAYHTLTGLSALPAGIIAGLLWTSVGNNATFIYGASVGGACGLFLIFSVNYLSKKPK
jgi:MFS family permease